MKLLSLVFACGLLAACGGDDGGSVIDAPASDGASAACTGALYDRCTDNNQCMSGNCRMFNDLGAMMCTEACTPGGAACPMQDGMAVTCSMNSMVCRPVVASTCTP